MKTEEEIFLAFAVNKLMKHPPKEGATWSSFVNDLKLNGENSNRLFERICKMDISLSCNSEDRTYRSFSILENFSGEWGLILSRNIPVDQYPFELGILCFKTKVYYKFQIFGSIPEWNKFRAQFPLED